MPRIDIGAVLAEKAPRLARWVPGFVLRWLRRTIHEPEINYILEHYWNLPPQEFIRACFREWQVTYSVEGLEKLDPKGRYLFASNHPFGGMDGMMLADKLIDRFGDIPKSVDNLLRVAELKAMAHRAYVTEVDINTQEIRIELYPKAKLDVTGIPALIAGYKTALRFAQGEKPVLFYQDKGKKHKDCEPMMEKAKELLGKLGELAESKK